MSGTVVGFHGMLRPATGSDPRIRVGRHGTVASDAEERIDLALHGKISNLDEVRREIGVAPDMRPVQVLLAGWRRWSEGLLSRLNGTFALAVHRNAKLLLYRDPSGLHNLYAWTGRCGEVAFATDTASLFQQAGVPPRVERRSVHEFLRFLDIAATNTVFENVIAIEPGQAMSWTESSGLQTVPLAAVAAEQQPHSFDEALGQIDTVLQRSVGAQLAGAEHPAAFLSGGIDSALLCALAARQRPDTVALTVGFAEAPYDEAPAAQRIARHLGLAHEILRFDRGQFLSALDRLTRGMDQPMADPATPATLLAFDYAFGRFDIVLDGTGADEAVGMMPPRHVRLAVAQASRLPKPLRKATVLALKRVPGLAPYAPVFDFEHPAEMMIRWKGFTRPEVEALTGTAVSFDQTRFYRTFAHFPRHAHFERYSALINAMPCDRLNQAMAISGLEPRFPFCDTAVDHYLRQLQTDFRYLPGHPKRILRAVLARYVPAALWDAPKHGFDFPLASFLAGDGFSLVRKHLDADRWRATGLLVPELVQHFAERFIAGERTLAFRVWALVILDAWLENHMSSASMTP
jgi:asparagine synthase (glutamine-hydrolysing)